MNFSPNYLAWTPNPAVNRTLRIEPRKAGYLERWKYHRKFVFDENHDIDSIYVIKGCAICLGYLLFIQQ
jgi:hypothetical protein